MTRALAALLAAALLVLTACGSDEPESAIPESEPFNQADVDFATDMFLHHSQALLVVDVAAPRQDLSPGLARLLDQLRDTRTVESEQLVDWLEEWDQPVPDNPRQHGGGEGSTSAHDLPGAVSEEDLARLEAARGDEFERLWLETMVEHHRGAVELAEAEVAEGEFPDAVALAEQIAAAQAAEVDRMEQLLD